MSTYTRLVLATTAALLLTGCLTRPQMPTAYYTLDYIAESERAELRRQSPYPVSVHVRDTEIARAYGRPQIVERGIGPQFSYLERHLWGVDLSDTVADLVAQRVERYGITEQTLREFTREPADYEVRSAIEAIEYVRYGNSERAVVSVTLTLWDVNLDQRVFRVRERSDRSIFGNDVGIFVSEANTMLLEHVDAFLSSVSDYLADGTLPESGKTGSGPRTAEGDAEERTGPGVLLTPRLSDAPNAPFFTVFGPEGSEVGTYQVGEPVSLSPGIYSVLLGSGPPETRISIRGLEVRSGQQTVVEPQWGTITVEIVDEDREQTRVRYDIYDSSTGQSYGGRISTTEQFVNARTVWVLSPGDYKIVINNRPFTTLRDFVTVRLPAGTSESLTIVVETDDAGNVISMLGAGDISSDRLEDDASPLSVTSALNASFSLTADNEETQAGLAAVYFLDSEIDTELAYEVGPLSYALENTIAVGFNAVNRSSLRVASDEFRLRNTLIYSLTDLFGLYARADANAPLTGNQLLRDEPFNYIKRDGSAIVEQETDVSEVRLSPPFLPLSLREGFGLNINAWQSSQVDVGLRGGIGATQTIRAQTYSSAGEAVIDTVRYRVFESQGSEFDTGLELLGIVTALLPFNTSVSTTAELFVPFAADGAIQIRLENVVNIVLVNNVSLFYRYLMRLAETVDGEPFLVHDHGVFLRLNSLFRL